MLIMTNNKQFKNCANKAPKKVSLSHINVNLIRNKLDGLSEFTCGLVKFLAVSVTKLETLSGKKKLGKSD